MKKGKVIALLIAASISSSMMVGCGSQDGAKTKSSATQNEEYVLSFVAADKTNWDKEVTIGNYKYKVSVDLRDDNTLKLIGMCIGEAEAEEQNGAGEMGPDQMGPEQGGAPEAEAAPEGEQEAEGEKEQEEAETTGSKDLSKYDFDMDGTWTYEDGWGYTLKFEDGEDTTVTANFDKASSRQYFYYDLAPTIDGEKVEAGMIQLQAKDTKFRSEMAEDYVTAEERNATYIFEGKGTTATGNASTIKIYCRNDNTVAMLSNKGSETSYSVGTWEEDSTAHKFIITIDGSEFKADYCDVAGKEGYRVTMTIGGGMGPSSSLVCYVAVAEGVNVEEYTDADFEGAAVKTMTCAEGDYTIDLTEKGFLKVKSGDSVSETSTYTYDQATDTYTLVVSGETYTMTNNGGAYSAEITITVQQMMGSEEVTRTFTCQ